MGIHTLPLLIYGARIKYKDIQRIKKEMIEDEDTYDFWKEHKILRVAPYGFHEYIGDNDCNWYYIIHKFKNSYSFSKPTMFKEINIPEYDEKQVKKDLSKLGIKKYKIGFYIDADIG